MYEIGKCPRCIREQESYDDCSHICGHCYDRRYSVKYTPNIISMGTRIAYFAFSLSVIIYSIWGFDNGKIYLAFGGQRSGGAAYVLGGTGLVLAVIALVSFALSALLTVVDHYDKRNNEEMYKKTKFLLSVSGWYLYLFSIIVYGQKI